MKTRSCCCGAPSTNPAACGCCEGVEALTPLFTANRPGLPAISYRVGTHSAFLETMKARLSSADYAALADLTSREADDPSIALLDAWATVGDVLTFYQERIANEAYLRTATERRSILELARLIGYEPRPGVASSVYLAYTIDPNYSEETRIPAGSRSQSIPGPGETAQSFETSEDLKARAQWNNLQPRLTQPQTEASIQNGVGGRRQVYLKGITTNLKPNDALLISFSTGKPEFFRVQEVVADAVANRTQVILQGGASDSGPSNKEAIPLIEALSAPPSVPPANAFKLTRKLQDQFGPSGAQETRDKLRASLFSNQASYTAIKAFTPALSRTLAVAAANAEVAGRNPIRVYALRKQAGLFGHNLPLPKLIEDLTITHGPVSTEAEALTTLALDAEYNEIKAGDWVALERVSKEPTVHEVERVEKRTLGGPQEKELAFFSTLAPVTTTTVNGVTSTSTGDPIRTKVTVLTLKEPWGDKAESKAVIRTTSLDFETEELELDEEPILEPVCGGADDPIELDGFYDGLEAGRWVIVSGEREVQGTSGVRFAELSMLSVVAQGLRPFGESGPLHGDRTHSFIQLAEPLSYCFKRDTVRIHGNVVLATHGETRSETLGSGDSGKPLQQFSLKQPPLTFVPAPNPAGVDSTLKVFVNDVRWRESPTLFGLGQKDRRFVTKTDDDGTTGIVFGNGREGARLPTGTENVRAVYRSGIGAEGNVRAEQISLLSTRPLGAKEVLNPLPATGGADRESRDQARVNAPLAVMALDRLVSVRDYQDFTRVFAGIGKALAREVSDGRRQIVHLTIAGANDIPIETHSDLYRNLTEALRRFGDRDQAFRIDLRELKLLMVSARVRIHPDYLWEKVEPQIRLALLDAFSFERRDLGQDALLSEVLSVMHQIPAVEYVDVDAFGGVSERNADRKLRSPAEVATAVAEIVEASRQGRPPSRVRADTADSLQAVLPAGLAYLSPLVPDSLILNEVPR